MLSSLFVLALAVLAPSVHANVFTTEPTATTTWTAGQPVSITWQDDGLSPNLTAFSPCSIGLYVGSQTQQTLLQLIASNVNVATTNSQTWTPDATVGPNSPDYFIRFTSTSLPNANQTNAFAEAFSAKFTLAGMTGTFNASVQAQINGSSVPGSTSTSSSSGLSTGLTSSTSSKPVTTPTTVKSSSSPSGSSTKSNGAGRVVVPSVVGASGIAAIAFALFF